MRLPRLKEIAGDLRTLFDVYNGGQLPHGYVAGDEEVRVGVVMGAQVLSGGRPSRTLEARTRHAARLYLEGGLDLLIPTGGTGEHPPSEAVVMTKILTESGVPKGAILAEDRALNTWESAVIVAGIARKRGIADARVITDPLHCPRAVRAFREIGVRAWAEPVYGTPMWRVPWLRRGQLAREMVASIWYRTWYGIRSRSLP